MASVRHPETYYLAPTPHVPNSPLPALIYRQVLDHADGKITPESTRLTIERNHWLQGGVFKTYKAHHFHSVTHECYAVFRGRSTLLLGVGPTDQEDGMQVEIDAGDIIVLPAGVSHCSISSEGDYSYLGLYPEGSPHWDNNFCKAGEDETRRKAEIASKVPVPDYDPIYGRDGPLVQIWQQALGRSER